MYTFMNYELNESINHNKLMHAFGEANKSNNLNARLKVHNESEYKEHHIRKLLHFNILNTFYIAPCKHVTANISPSLI